jgi:hypothetical protein
MGVAEALGQPMWSLGQIELAEEAWSLVVVPHTVDHLYQGAPVLILNKSRNFINSLVT